MVFVWHPTTTFASSYDRQITFVTMSTSAPSPTIQVLFFASAKDAARTPSLSLPLPSSSTPYTLSHLAKDLVGRYPGKLVNILETSTWAVNEEMVPDEEVEGQVLRGGDVVAVLPPVSGG
jgi:molybdopterin converting factor small subunit